MKMKRFVALLLAALMLISTPVQAAGTNTVPTTAESTESVTNREAAIAEKNGEAAEETEEQENILFTPTETEEPEQANKLENSDQLTQEQSNVITGDDVVPMENGDDKATAEEDDSVATGEMKITEIDRDDIDVDLTNDGEATQLLDETTVSAEDEVKVIVVMEDKSIIEKNSKASVNLLTKIQMSLMEMKQNSIISKIEKKVFDGEELSIEYQYKWLLNGFATTVPYGTIEEIEALSGVKQVLLQTVYDTCDTTVDPNTVADGVMIGRDDTWASGYTGEGIKISIIDTGLDADHQNFAALSEDKLTEDSATKDSVASVIGSLNASAIIDGLTADDVYQSTKVAYGFNYVDGNLDITHDNDSQGDHGTHVAGIAAANDLDNGEAVGVAPDAQLYVMKVFGANGGAYTEDLLAAVEDSLLLGADVINMSLGSPAGFTSDGEMYDEIYGRVDDTNTILCISAGNSTTSGYGNLWGTNTNLTSNPDNSVIGSPAIYVNATSVASVENVGITGYYLEVDGTKLTYSDGSGTQAKFLTLGGGTYDYAMVGNYGQTAEDFAEADVEGKIAVVQRGITTFTDKHQLAEDAGAVAVVIYNNTSGTIGLDLSSGTATIPCVSITIADGEYLAYAKEQNPEATLFVSEDTATVANPDAYKMSDFSSWGVSPNLSLEPDVTGPGGNIYSTLDGGTYGVMSGTSMSSPNVAGIAALVMQYAKANFPDLSDEELHYFVNRLIVSTATPLAYDDTTDYSPRNQGSGLANAYDAINTDAYLTIEGMDVAKAELGDDVDKTGSYEYSFDVVNFGEDTLYYTLDTTTQTEGVLDYGIYFMSTTPVVLDAATTETSDNLVGNYDYNEDGQTDTADARWLYLKVLAEETLDLNGAFRYDLNGDDAVTLDDVQMYLDILVGKDEFAEFDLTQQTLVVPAGETATVTVNIDVTDAGKEYMDTYFENGIYVEGFTKLTAMNSAVDLSLPYLAFYGDWTQAPILDSGYYWQSEEEAIANQYYHVIFGNYGTTGEYVWYPGLNPYIDEEFDMNNVSVSPNGDSYMDYFEDIYVSLLRNAKTLNFTYTDAETGEVYFDEQIENVNKSYYADAYGMVIPYVYSWYSYPYMFVDAEGNTLADGTELTFTVTATLDYDAHESNNLSDTWEMPVTIDLEAPEILAARTYQDEETGKFYMEITVQDGVGVAAVNICNKAGTMLLAQEAVDKGEKGEAVTMTYDVTGYGEDLMVILGDYAFNESAYLLEVEGNAPEVDESLLYGYRVYDANYYDDTLYGWIGIDPETAVIDVYSSEYYVDYALVAATYVGGQIIAVDANDDLVGIKPGYWDERTKIASLGTTVSQLAFDDTTGTLYGYDKDNYALVTIDVVTGEMTRVTGEYDYFSSLHAMAFADGVLYGIYTGGQLKKIDTETGKWSTAEDATVLKTGLYPTNAQSMAYDKDSNSLYWVYYSYTSYYGEVGTLYQINLTDNTFKKIGTVGGKAEVVGLLTMDESEYTLPEVTLESIAIDKELVTLLPGGKQTLNVLKNPWYADAEDYVWSSADESVAVVQSGIVKGVAEGETTITVKTEDDKYSATATVRVVAPESDLYGFSMVGDTTYNQWISFSADDTSIEALSEVDFTSLYCGEYLDGYVYTYSDAGEFYKVDAETFEKTKISGDVCEGYSYMGDMAYDYSTGFMYGLYMDDYGYTYLVQIDTMTGNFDIVSEALANEYGTPILCLAIDNDGTMYMLSMEGLLYTYDAETGVLTKVGYTGYSASSYTQCMAIDHNTGELYWTMIGSTASLMYVDKETGAALELGQVDGFSQIVAMYAVPEEVPARDEVSVENFTALEEKVTLLENASVVAPVSVTPYNATDRTITWTIGDDSIVDITDNMIVGKKAGTTTITGKVGELTVTIEVEVLESTGALRGYVLTDLSTGSGLFWGEFLDYDLSAGNGLAMGDTYNMYAGEYYDGKIYGYGPTSDTWEYSFYVIDGETFEVEQTIACASDAPDVVEMAFDYSTGTMYAVAGTQNVSGSNNLYMIDITNGKAYKVASLDAQIMALACTEAGDMYGVSAEGTLYQINKTTGELTLIGETGYGANQYQSMAYDYDTGNMYWAQAYYDMMSWSTTTGLLLLNVEDASVTNLGVIGTRGCMVSALHIVPDKTLEVKAPEEVTGLILSQASELLSVGESFQLTAKTMPLSVVEADVDITFTSDNTEVATVAEDGTITAVGEGKAVITAACEEATAECVVNVVGTDTELYIVNPSGMEVSPLLDPATVETVATFTEESGFAPVKAVYNQDGYFYGVDKAGDLWKYTEDLTVLEKIGNITSQLENAEDIVSDDTEIVVCDLEANAFTGKVYALIGFVGYWSEEYYIYEVDTATAAGTMKLFVDYSVGRPGDIAFMGETAVAIYDTYQDYVYTSDISEMYYGASQLAFVQFTVASGDHLSMTYSKELNYLFIATDDGYHYDGTPALYKLNPETGAISAVGNAAYNEEMGSIFLIEGTTPVTGQVSEAE